MDGHIVNATCETEPSPSPTHTEHFYLVCRKCRIADLYYAIELSWPADQNGRWMADPTDASAFYKEQAETLVGQLETRYKKNAFYMEKA